MTNDTTWSRVWRNPNEETEDYPDLVVHDGRCTGSITLGRSRLPVWAFGGVWARAEEGWAGTYPDGSDSLHGWTEEKWSAFLYYLLEQRGEFARLICILADVNRIEMTEESKFFDEHFAEVHPDPNDDSGCDCDLPDAGPWYEQKPLRDRMLSTLRNCVSLLEELEKKDEGQQEAATGSG